MRYLGNLKKNSRIVLSAVLLKYNDWLCVLWNKIRTWAAWKALFIMLSYNRLLVYMVNDLNDDCNFVNYCPTSLNKEMVYLYKGISNLFTKNKYKTLYCFLSINCNWMWTVYAYVSFKVLIHRGFSHLASFLYTHIINSTYTVQQYMNDKSKH